MVIDMGVDYIEFDFVVMKDGVLIVWYELMLSGMIDVVNKFEFVFCKMICKVDGVDMIDWFVSDFIFVEIK